MGSRAISVPLAPGRRRSSNAVVGHICHIYAAADKGPRGKPGLTAKERNAPENLILMCGHHHPSVDKQWMDYPATLLLEWKKAHESRARAGTEAIEGEQDIQKHAFIEQMSDEQIEKAITRITYSRVRRPGRRPPPWPLLGCRDRPRRFAGAAASRRGVGGIPASPECSRVAVHAPSGIGSMARPRLPGDG